jgi:predicted DNA-binding WGR domain protein
MASDPGGERRLRPGGSYPDRQGHPHTPGRQMDAGRRPQRDTALSGAVRGGQRMSAIVLTRHGPAWNMHRYYALDLQPDLFGVSCLIREWGRVGSQADVQHHLPYSRSSRSRACEAALGQGAAELWR